MSRAAKVLKAAKANPAGLSFSELKALVVAAGFELKRVNGSHHVYSRPNTLEIINIQADGSKAKTYQVRQVLGLIDKYNIEIE